MVHRYRTPSRPPHVLVKTEQGDVTGMLILDGLRIPVEIQNPIFLPSDLPLRRATQRILLFWWEENHVTGQPRS